MSAIPANVLKVIALAWLALGGAGLLTAYLRPIDARLLIERGLIDLVVTYELALPLFGLGVALSQLGRWQRPFGGLMFCVAIPLGLIAEHRVLAAGSGLSAYPKHITLLGPLCCLATGVTLALPGRMRLLVVPLAALIAGLGLGFFIGTRDPSIDDHWFSIGASAAGLWLVSIAPVVVGRLSGRWLTIGGRIFASWLVAIGLMLGAARLTATKGNQAMEVGPAAATPDRSSTPAMPGSEPPPLHPKPLHRPGDAAHEP